MNEGNGLSNNKNKGYIACVIGFDMDRNAQINVCSVLS